MKVKELPVDGRIIKVLLERGIEELYPPQAEALRSGVLEGENLLLAIPTASGKTLVAEVVMLNRIFREGGKAVYLVPLKALAEEKFREFRDWERFGVRIGVTTGDYDSSDEWLGKYDIIISTSEKFDSILRHRASWIKDVKLIVADEVHLLGSYNRGATLEMILSHMLGKAQILALSATVGNAEELAEWLNAKLVMSDWRPVKLRKGVFYMGELRWEDGTVEHFSSDWDGLVVDAVKRGKGALVFVNTRRSAERESIRLGKKVGRLLTKPEKRALEGLVSEMEDNPTNTRLKEAIMNGVAFHHAGLSRDARTTIEDAFREGLIKSIVATPTLCMHPETPVITRKGIKKVSELKEGDEVLTHSGSFKKVISPLKRPHKGKMLVIKAIGTVPVRITPEHMVWVVKRIRHKSHYSDGRQVIWWEFKGPEWMTAQELKELVEHNDDKKVSYMLLQPIPDSTANTDRIPLRKTIYISNQFGKTDKLHSSVKRTPEFLPLNFETARLIGLWIAEGSTSKNGVVKFDIGSHENEITEFLVQTIKKYFPHANVAVNDHERNRRIIRFCNKRFAEWLRENIGYRAHNKKIPDVLLFNKNREVRLGLLRGLLEGDGYIRRGNERRANYIAYTTVSPTLAYQLQLFLGSLGYVSSISRSVRRSGIGKSRKPIYTVKISGRSYYKLLDEIGLRVPPKGNRTYNLNTIWDGYLLFKVRSVEEEHYEGDVYNLEVEDDESYSVGFIVHNSAGVNLPSFRVIIRDTKRYSSFGWTDIPVLEIQQMLGRAGRPRYDREGEAIVVAKENEDPEDKFKRYILGKPEKLFSMLSNESAFRSQVLALITNFGIGSFDGLTAFLRKTFFHHQRGDVYSLAERAKRIIWFLFENGFIDMTLNDRFLPLPFGIRTSQLYLDPLTAKRFKDALPTLEKNPNPLGVFHLLSSTPDMSSFYAKKNEMDDLVDFAYEMEEHLYREMPYEDYELQLFLGHLKTAKILLDWINEVHEERILEEYKIDPGDLYRTLELADWLLYSLIEIYKLFDPKESVLKFLQDLRLRVKHGVREELLPLVKLPMVGRKRARALYIAGFKTPEDIAKAKPSQLLKVEGIGPGVLREIYRELNIEVNVEEKRPRKTLDAFLK